MARHEKRADGYATTNIELAAGMWTVDGVEVKGIEGEGKEKMFVFKGDPDMLADYKHKWYNGEPFGHFKKFAEKRRHLLALLPRE